MACAQPSVVDQVVTDACEKQAVLLGELPSHGEAQAFQTKAEIVDELVSQCGFDVLLFEAGVYDFLGFEEALAEGQATFRQLNRAIGRFWWTEGLAGWRQGLFDQATAGTLTLGGLDDQPSVTSDYARAALPELVASALSADQVDVCRDALDRNLHWRYDDEHSFDTAEQALLARCTQEAAQVAAETASSPQQRMLESIASYYARQLDDAPDRDAVMNRTLNWYRARQPESKVIVWTATVHAARQQGGLSTQPLGAHLAELGDALAVIGFTAAGGTSSMAGMPSQPLEEAPPGSLEAQAVAGAEPLVYLDASALRGLGDVASRLLGRLSVSDWSTSFDGVVVVREETPPVFEAWR